MDYNKGNITQEKIDELRKKKDSDFPEEDKED